MSRHRLLFVCLGNICRSPLAEGVFGHAAARARCEGDFDLDSAGTAGWHIGRGPDERARRAALNRGIDISRQSARQATREDFRNFDMILAMDADNVRELEYLAPEDARAQVRLFMEFAPEAGVGEVPDPYYGGPEGFDEALDLIEAASQGLLAHLTKTD